MLLTYGRLYCESIADGNRRGMVGKCMPATSPRKSPTWCIQGSGANIAWNSYVEQITPRCSPIGRGAGFVIRLVGVRIPAWGPFRDRVAEQLGAVPCKFRYAGATPAPVFLSWNLI